MRTLKTQATWSVSLKDVFDFWTLLFLAAMKWAASFTWLFLALKYPAPLQAHRMEGPQYGLMSLQEGAKLNLYTL